MGYSTDDSMCRIDFFKESGKWYATEAVRMDYEGSGDRLGLIDALRKMPDEFKMPNGKFRYSGMWAVVIEPHHKFAHPQMFKVPEDFDA